MTSPFGRSLFIGILLTTLITGLFVVATNHSRPSEVTSEETITQPTPPDTIPFFDVVLLETRDTQRRLTLCQPQGCQTLTPVASDNTHAVTDGQSWYHYQRGSLRRTWIADGQSQVIVDQTPLIASRDLIISPDNKKVAYWLDNIDQPKRQLTELWVYDADQSGTKLLAENLEQLAVITKARWNKSSNYLWFVGDDKKLNIVSLQPPSIATRFNDPNWLKLKNVADHGAMDLSSTGQSLAYAEPTILKRSKIIILSEGSTPRTTVVRGRVPYLQWLNDDSLLYATQSSGDFTFWLLKGSLQQHVARHPGTLKSVRTDNQNNFAVFASQTGRQPTRLFALNIEQRNIVNLDYKVPTFGQHTHLVHVEAKSDQTGSVAGLTQPLDDDQLAAFIDNNLPDIIHQTNVRQKRLTVTDKPNTIYVDYRDGTGIDKRILLTVRDAIYPEWSVLSHFEESFGEWIKTQGGGLADPQPLRLYEWEEKLEQWILKEEY